MDNDSGNSLISRKISNVDFAVEDLTKHEHRNRFDLIVCVERMAE